MAVAGLLQPHHHAIGGATAIDHGEPQLNAKQALRAFAAWLLPSLVAPLSTV